MFHNIAQCIILNVLYIVNVTARNVKVLGVRADRPRDVPGTTDVPPPPVSALATRARLAPAPYALEVIAESSFIFLYLTHLNPF